MIDGRKRVIGKSKKSRLKNADLTNVITSMREVLGDTREIRENRHHREYAKICGVSGVHI